MRRGGGGSGVNAAPASPGTAAVMLSLRTALTFRSSSTVVWMIAMLSFSACDRCCFKYCPACRGEHSIWNGGVRTLCGGWNTICPGWCSYNDSGLLVCALTSLKGLTPGGRPVKSTPSRGSREADRGVCTNRIPSPGALPCDAVECSRVMLWGLAVLSCGDAMTALRGRGRWALPRGLCCGGPAAKRPTFLGDDCVAGAVLGRTRGEGCAVCGCCSCHVGVYEVKPRDVGSGEAVRPQEDVLRADVGYETGTTLYKALGNGVSGWANLQVGGCAREVRPVPSSQLGSWSSAHLYGVGCNMSACPSGLLDSDAGRSMSRGRGRWSSGVTVLPLLRCRSCL
mmetsp:Transcript_72017/g.120769  ORF Transcript_72017/g.120769 Transcript_72017/m.120769 type:complete len:339 (+) Transcript_72017:2197-3213(+)